MTDSSNIQAQPTVAATSAPGDPAHFELIPETFWNVAYRRTRYAVAIAVSAFIFCTLGWYFAAPPAQYGGISLLFWPSQGMFGGFVNALVLAALLVVTAAICSLLVHPDTPHMGLFCALLGMAGMSIRGGGVHMLLQFAMETNTYQKMAQILAVECIQWAMLFLIAEVFSRLLHDRFFANTHWITRSAPELSHQNYGELPGTAMGVSLAVSRALRTKDMRRRVATPLAVAYSSGIAFLMLYVFMQSQLKGQVLMACFVAYAISTFLAYLAFPRVPILAMLMVVPITAAVAYLYGALRPDTPYPGQAGFFAMRALPIDFISTGVPGAIFGYYRGFRWSLHSPENA